MTTKLAEDRERLIALVEHIVKVLQLKGTIVGAHIDREMAKVRGEDEIADTPTPDLLALLDAANARSEKLALAESLHSKSPKERYDLQRRRFTRCQSDDDGHCVWRECPQLRDGEPERSGRHCPLDQTPNAESLRERTE